MKRLNLSDALVREALSPDPHAATPAGLLAQISADVARTPQRRTLGLSFLPQSRRLAWTVVGAATLLVLFATLLVAGGSRNPFEAVVPPTPSPLPQRLPVSVAMAAEIEAVSADEAWASVGTGELWHRTAAGWAGPIVPLSTPRDDQVRDLARMPDGRIVVSADLGIWVGDERGWTRVAQSGGGGVAVDAAGVIWAGSMGGERGLRAYREVDGAWTPEAYACGAGGFLVAASTDGSVWTAGIDYSGSGGVARVEAGACGEVKPWGDGTTHEAMALATGDGSSVALRILDLPTGDAYTRGRIMTWDGNRWSTLRDDSATATGGWSGLAYGPDGTLWAAFDSRLLHYVNGVETLVRDNIGQGPVSVAPDGSVWFVAQDPVTGSTFIDRLVPGDGAAQPTPPPTASPMAELKADRTAGALGVRLLGRDQEGAWATRFDGPGIGLWNRTEAGWTGPIPIASGGVAYDMEDLGDGRLAVATVDSGLWVGDEDSWARAWGGTAHGVARAADGTLWVSGTAYGGANGASTSLHAFREDGAGWHDAWSGCRAGGTSVVIAADGAVWTSGITYTDLGGVARFKDGECEEVFPLGEGKGDEVMAIAASPDGAVAVLILDTDPSGSPTGGHVVEWRDGRWTDLRTGPDVVGAWFGSLAYAPDGALWAVFGEGLHRYADGAWQKVADALSGSQVSVTDDGTIWYIRGDAVVDRLPPGDVQLDPVVPR